MLRNIPYIIYGIIIFSYNAFSIESANTGCSSDISSMTIEELMNVKVCTVSSFLETKKDASGNMIYLEKSELIQRGYNDLVEVFNDLPGIDLAQTWGDLYYKTYWRGYRQGLSSPFLLMLDGKTINHLYYHWTDILVTIPISMVDHIEIVYGPVSSVYGANALMGVMNIITTRDKEEEGTSVDAKFSYGEFNSRVSDVTIFHKTEDLSFRVSAFLNFGDLDTDKLEQYEYTKSKYVNDKKLWGEFINSDFFGGKQSAYRENKGFAVSTFLGNSELGFQYYRVDSKYGVNYAFDKAAPSSAQIQDDYFFFFESKNNLGEKIESSTYLRYRQSGLPNSSATLEEDSPYGEQRKIRYGIWQLTNNSWSVYQDFDVNLVNNLNLKLGFNYEAQQLQKSYEIAWGETVSPENSAGYEYPEPPVNVPRLNNSMLWEYYGINLQTKYELSELFNSNAKHYISAGLRYDHNTAFGTFLTYRLAYVLNYFNFGFKLLYGTAIQEPAARLLYGGWVGSQDNIELEPEKSRNLESMWFYADNTYYVMINPYYSNVYNAINNINRIPMNIAERKMFGVDMHFSFRQEIFKGIEY